MKEPWTPERIKALPKGARKLRELLCSRLADTKKRRLVTFEQTKTESILDMSHCKADNIFLGRNTGHIGYLAEVLGVAPENVSMWLSDIKPIPANHLPKIAKALSLDDDERRELFTAVIEPEKYGKKDNVNRAHLAPNPKNRPLFWVYLKALVNACYIVTEGNDKGKVGFLERFNA